VFFIVLLVLSFGADRFKARNSKTAEQLSIEEEAGAAPVIPYTHVEIYKELIAEKQGETAKNDEQVARRKQMKEFLQQTLGTTEINRIQLDDLKKALDQESNISRIKYRRQVGNFLTGKRKEIAKGEIIKQEHAHADNIEDAERNRDFGFHCLHYSVSEASGSLKIKILNKNPDSAKQVRVRTIDAEAIAGDDYEAVDKLIEFAVGQKEDLIEVTINDDDNWEPDEDFFVQLYDANSNIELGGKDTRTRVTIIDDDKPGQICFSDSKNIKVLGNEEECIVKIVRKNGADGTVTVDYETFDLDQSGHTATANIDYKPVQGTLTFL